MAIKSTISQQWLEDSGTSAFFHHHTTLCAIDNNRALVARGGGLGRLYGFPVWSCTWSCSRRNQWIPVLSCLWYCHWNHFDAYDHTHRRCINKVEEKGGHPAIFIPNNVITVEIFTSFGFTIVMLIATFNEVHQQSWGGQGSPLHTLWIDTLQVTILIIMIRNGNEEGCEDVDHDHEPKTKKSSLFRQLCLRRRSCSCCWVSGHFYLNTHHQHLSSTSVISTLCTHDQHLSAAAITLPS